MINKIYQFVLSLNISFSIFGISRSLLALGGLSLFLFNDMSVILFNNSPVGFVALPKEFVFNEINIFSIFPESYSFLSWVLSVLILVLVFIGWRPRFTAIPHCWLLFSLFYYTMVPDGGDQISLILSLLLLPICLMDNRKWHWQNNQNVDFRYKPVYNLVILFFWLLIKLQVSALYFEAATSKLQVTEWANGTAVYYWFTNPMFGASGWILNMLKPVLSNSFGVTLLTWGSLFVEILLFMGIVIRKKFKPYLLGVGIFFHFCILLVHGLVSFFFFISAALVLYLIPFDADIKVNISNVKKLIEKIP